MESEAQKETVNAGESISTCSAVVNRSKDEILFNAKKVSEFISNDDLPDDASAYCEFKRLVTLPNDEYSSLEGYCENRDEKCLKDHLDGNVITTVSSESAEDHHHTLSDGNISGSKTESIAPLSPIDQNDAVIMMNLVEETSCSKKHESLVPPTGENTSFQSSPSKRSVNFLSSEVPHTEVIQTGSIVTVVESGKKEIVCSVSTNNDTNHFGIRSSPNSTKVSKGLDERAYKEQDENISCDDKPVDYNGKGKINLENISENVIERVSKESYLGNSPVLSRNEENASSFSNEGGKVCDKFSIRNDILEVKILDPVFNQGEKCDSEKDKPSDICIKDKNENPHFHSCCVNTDCDSKSELQNCNRINYAISEDGASVNNLAPKDSGVCHTSIGDMQSFAGVSDSNKLKAVSSNASCKGPLNYRESSDSSSESELTSSSDDESVTEITDVDGTIRKHGRRPEPVCHGEILLTDLPPIEDLNISVPEEECVKIGEISSIVGELAVIQSLPNTPALNIDSVLFLDHGKTTLGKIFDVLGPVKEPFYTVRFNSEHHARERGVAIGADVFCAPRTDHTAYVFLAEMMKMKGSDASWEHNNEPPPVCLDYSDDEQERLARRAVAHQRYGDDRDGGPPRKKRGTRNRMGNSNQLNGGNQRGNFLDSARSDVSPVGGYFSQSLPHATSYSPLLPPRPVFPSVAQRVTAGYSGQYNSPPLMLGRPPPNFRPPMRTGYNNPLFEAPLRNFTSSASPGLPPNLPTPMNSPPPYFIRPFHMLPSVPLVPLPPLPPYLSSPHVRPILCPPRFRPPMDDQRGPGTF